MLKFLFILLFTLPFVEVFTQYHYAELVYQETDISFKNGKLIKNETYEIKIYSREGEKFTNISIPYSKLCKLSGIEACIKDKNGTIIKKLQNSDISFKSAISDFSLYEDDFVKEFTLKHNSYPYSIIYSYHYQEEEFFVY